MPKYIDTSACPQCDEYIKPFGCTNHQCPIYIDYELGREEMAADEEHDRRKDNGIQAK